VYVGGKIITGPTGVDYDNQPRFFFLKMKIHISIM
jgi:hypothetical protein